MGWGGVGQASGALNLGGGGSDPGQTLSLKMPLSSQFCLAFRDWTLIGP